MNERDIFLRQIKYPDAEAIFSWHPKTLSQIKDDCIIVLDTNVLLFPYRHEKKNLLEIGDIYRRLVNNNRLIIPGQVAREFADHRISHISNIYYHISQTKKSARPPTVNLVEYPLLTDTSEYVEAKAAESALNEDYSKLKQQVERYQESISRLQDLIKGWYWNDPVSLLYKELFASNVVIDVPVDEAEVTEDLLLRKKNSIPPGYKDSKMQAKENSAVKESSTEELSGGIGDLLIWRTILEVGKTQKKSILFVTGEKKPDWWVKSDTTTLYPRYELVDEFRRHSDGRSFHILGFSDFLDLYGASKELVHSVKQDEASQAETPVYDFVVRNGYWCAEGRVTLRTTEYALNGEGFSMRGGGGEYGDIHAQGLSPFRRGERISVAGSFQSMEHFGGCSIGINGTHYGFRYKTIDPPSWLSGKLKFKGGYFELPFDTSEESITLTTLFDFKGELTGHSADSVTPSFLVRLRGTGEVKLDLELGNYGEEGPLYDFKSIRYEFH